MEYHELRVLVPTKGWVSGEPIGGVRVVQLVHDALAPMVAEKLDETAPVIVVWESLRIVAASGAL